MTVRDLIKQDIDIDVYDDVDESLGIAFCGPLDLTRDGEMKFQEVLDYKIELRTGTCLGDIVIVHVDDPDENVWKHRLRMAKLFFRSAAGYCASDDYDAWFNS